MLLQTLATIAVAASGPALALTTSKAQVESTLPWTRSQVDCAGDATTCGAASKARHARKDLATYLYTPSSGPREFVHIDKPSSKSGSGSVKHDVTGICDDTPGARQYSGYLENTDTFGRMWYWLAEARHGPESAPLVVWLNSGSGCSSMKSLFMENGPCTVHHASPTLPVYNQFSWTEHAHMLYIDQPAGTGFSFGNWTLGNEPLASSRVTAFLQTFLDTFPQYRGRDVGLFAQSFGAKYAAEAGALVLQDNANNKDDAGYHQIPLKAVGLGNAWIDPFLQYPTYATYWSQNAYKRLMSRRKKAAILENFLYLCLPNLIICRDRNAEGNCYWADINCAGHVRRYAVALADKYFNVNDVRRVKDDSEMPDGYLDFLHRDDIMQFIGAEKPYAECDAEASFQYAASGDAARSRLDDVTALVENNVTTLFWAGDADWIGNWVGILAVADAIPGRQQEEFASKKTRNYTVHSEVMGEYKSANNLHYLKVFNAGQAIAFHQPKLALQAFVQIMAGDLSPT